MKPTPTFDIPEFVIPALLVAWAVVGAHVRLVQARRLRGSSILTHFLASVCIASEPFIVWFVPEHWCSGGKWAIAGCALPLALALMVITKKAPAKTEAAKKWKKAERRRQVEQPTEPDALQRNSGAASRSLLGIRRL